MCMLMKHPLTEGFTSLSQEELLEIEGGGLLTNLVTGLTPAVRQLLGTLSGVSDLTGTFAKELVDILV